MEQTSFINDRKPVKTSHIFHADIVRCCQMYSTKVSVYSKSLHFAHLFHTYLSIRLCHMLQLTHAYFLFAEPNLAKKYCSCECALMFKESTDTWLNLFLQVNFKFMLRGIAPHHVTIVIWIL